MDPHLSRLVASRTAECMTNREIVYEESIVWSVDELFAAMRAWRTHVASHEEGSTPPSEDATDVDESLRVLEEWFDERYRSHAQNVAKVHLVRFLQICYFLYEHRDELERRGCTMGGWRDGHLLRALVTIRCSPELRPSADGGLTAPMDLDDVLRLRAAHAEGDLEVREFERVPWEQEPDPGEDGGSPDGYRPLGPGQLLAALVVVEDFAGLPPGEQVSRQRWLRRELSPRTGRELAEETDRRFILLAWLIEEVGMDLRAARRTADRVLAVDCFLEAYGPHLVHEGLAIWGRRIRWQPILIEALGSWDVSAWSSLSEIAFEEYRGIVAAAKALENFRERTRKEERSRSGALHPGSRSRSL